MNLGRGLFSPPSLLCTFALVFCRLCFRNLQTAAFTFGCSERRFEQGDVCVLQEEFCYPVECLALTVEEVMHIRQVLVKAELEKFQQYKDVYAALKKGKVGGGFSAAAGTIPR